MALQCCSCAEIIIRLGARWESASPAVSRARARRCAQECFAHIDTAMGGKAAEELIFGIDKVRAQ